VILGGIASTAGPVLGAFAFIFTEEFLKVLLNAVAPLFGKRDWAEYWAVLMGPLLVLSVIFFRRGLAGIFYKPDA
jgi:branched-chain amino acid transport system permease protein